jgi:hypothetical protein
MNSVEIEEGVSEPAAAPFDAAEFLYAFLAAFGNQDTTIKRLGSGASNASDVPGGVLQSTNIQLATCAPGCGSAPKRNPALMRRRRLKLFMKAIFGGVPIGADWDPAQFEIPKQF